MRIFILIISMISAFVYAEDGSGSTGAQFDDWSCYFKSVAVAENYQIDSYANNIYAEGDREYTSLCVLDHKFSIANTAYALHILFPECQFSNDNQMITTKLLKLEEGNNFIIDAAGYSLSFPPDANNFSGAEINQDQNAKSAFFIDLIEHDKMQLNIVDVGNIEINLSGVRQAMQTPYCNK